MLRRLPTLLAVLSLLICIGAVFAWERSYRVGGGFEMRLRERSWRLDWPVGRIALYWQGPGIGTVPLQPPYGYQLVNHPPIDMDLVYPPSGVTYRSFAGFGWLHEEIAWGVYGRTSAVFAPAWFVVLVTAVFPAWWLPREVRRHRRERRLRRGLCAQCGYDLRASPGRCPECGQIVPPVATA